MMGRLFIFSQTHPVMQSATSRFIGFLLFVILFSAGTADAQWQRTKGPTGADITALTVFNNQILAGSLYARVYRSGDNGTTWSEAKLPNTSVPSIITDFAVAGSAILASTSANGVFRSLDNGKTWTASNLGLFNFQVSSMVSTGTTVLASTSFAVFKSINAGSSWSKVGLGLPSGVIQDLAVSNGVIYAAVSGFGIYSSVDGGSNWLPLPGILPSNLFVSIAASNTSIYVVTDDAGVFRSQDNGLNWVEINNGIQWAPDKPLLGIFASATTLAVTSTDQRLLISYDQGDSWQAATNGVNDQFIRVVLFSDTATYLGSSGDGLYKSTDNGLSWSPSNQGIIGAAISGLATAGPYIFVTSGNYVWRSGDKGDTWEKLAANFANVNGPINDLVSRGDTLYVVGPGGIYSSVDLGAHWSAPFGPSLVNAIAFKGSRMLAASQFGLFSSSNWFEPIFRDQLKGVFVLGSTIFVASASQGLLRSVDDGITWTPVNNGLPGFVPDVRSLVGYGDKLIVGTRNGPFQSADNGDHWTILPNIASLEFNAILVDGTSLTLGTSSGEVYTSNDAVSFLRTTLNGAAIGPVKRLAVGFNTLFAGTLGASVYRAPYLFITSISPAAAYVGDLLTITGTGFSDVPQANTVQINGLPAEVLSSDKNSVRIKLPLNASTGTLSVTVAGQTVNSARPFVIATSKFLTHAGSIDKTTDPFLNLPDFVYVSGKYAYVTNNFGRNLDIIDVSNPSIPVHVGGLNNGDTGASFSLPIGVYVRGNYAYVVDYLSSSLQIIDVTNPVAPFLTGRINDGDGGAILTGSNWVTVSGNYAYVASYDAGALEIIDISNPALPVHVGSISDGEGGAALLGANGVFVSGNYAYVASYDASAFEIINVSNPATPVHAGVLRNGEGGAKLVNANNAVIQGNYAYVASFGSNALEIIDISNPAAPTHAGSLTDGTNGATLFQPIGIALSGHYAFLPSLNGRAVEAVDVSDPTNPLHVGSIPDGLGGAKLFGPNSIMFANDHLYVTAGNNLEILSINYPPPAVTGFTPASGVIGAQATITGVNFDPLPNYNEVRFNGIQTTVTSSTSTSITTTVPTGATTGKVSVKVNGLTATSVDDFKVLFPPTITSFSPQSGPAGTTVTLIGTNFSAVAVSNQVTFNGTVASITSASSTSLSVVVPKGAVTGTLAVVVDGLMATSANVFTVLQPPVITDFTPVTGPAGTVVTINGSNFSSLTSGNLVLFNGVSAVVTAATSTSITTSVPAAATTGPISITVNGLMATSEAAFTVTTTVVGEIELEIHPNPFRDRLFIKYELPERNKLPAAIQVFNNAGGLVGSTVISGGHEGTWVWDSTGLPPGYYLVRLTLGNKSVTKRALKK